MENPTAHEPERFRDRLLDAETPTPAYRERYQQEVNAMLERQLKPLEKVLVMATALFSAGCAAWFLILVATHTHLPSIAQGGLLAGALFAALWCFGAVRTVRRGTLRPQADVGAISAWAWCLGVLLATTFFMAAPRLPGNQGVLLALSGLCYVLFGAAFLITARIQQSETNTRLKLLEIELVLAELREQMVARSEPAA